MPPRDHLTQLFDRLCDLPLAQQRIELEGLELGHGEREELERLLAADQRNDDPIRQAVIAGAARMQRPQSVRFGAWRLIRELGAGGMGTVFLAERVEGEFQQQVAVKLLRGFPTSESMRRLRQERQILAGLDHPNIARLLDGGETDDGQPWLAMEYVAGSPLLEYVHRHAPLIRDRLALFDAMLEAIEHAHQRLIIHRDLKPANVLVADGGTLKLLDFGIARLIAVSEHEQRSTSTRIYSHGYASPEQKAGATITTASDTFSLGVMLREMLTGARETGAEHSPLIHPLKLDADMAGIIAKATSHNVDDRYSGVSEFRNDLDRYRDGRPVRASAMTRRYRLRKFVGRHRLVSMACVVILTILALFVWRLDRERNRAQIAEAVAQRARTASEQDAANARASLAFLTDALSAAGPDAAMSTQVRVRDLLDTARKKLELRSKVDGSFTKPMQRLLGSLYSQLGEARIARDLLSEGIEGVVPKDDVEALRLADDYEEYSMVLGALSESAQSLAAARTASQWRERFAPGDDVLRVRSLQMLGMVFHRDGKDEEAIDLVRKAYQLGNSKSMSDVDSRAESAQLLASLLATRGDCEEALKVADDGLALVESTLPDNATTMVPLLRARASALNTCGRPAEAEPVLREAISKQESLVAAGGSRMMHLTNDLALTLNDLGRYEEAAEMLGRSDQFMRETGLGGIDEAVSWSNRAGVLENAGDYDASLKALAKAIELLDDERVDGENQVRRRVERAQARTFGLVGRHDEAWKMLSGLRQACERIEGKDSGEYAMLTWQLASLAGRMKDSVRGLPMLDEAEQLWSALVPSTHAVFAHALRLRAGFAVARHAYGEAGRALVQAIALFEKGAASPVDLAIARSELAELRALEMRPEEARQLLGMAMPVLRSSLLATEVNRIHGERLALRLRLRI